MSILYIPCLIFLCVLSTGIAMAIVCFIFKLVVGD